MASWYNALFGNKEEVGYDACNDQANFPVLPDLNEVRLCNYII